MNKLNNMEKVKMMPYLKLKGASLGFTLSEEFFKILSDSDSLGFTSEYLSKGSLLTISFLHLKYVLLSFAWRETKFF